MALTASGDVAAPDPAPRGPVLRVATMADTGRIEALIALAIDRLLAGLLTPGQVAASHAFMALDTQLIQDGTYFVVEQGDTLIGSGGWSYRATVYGGDHSEGRDARLLDPSSEPARIRAMYTHPEYIRRGIGRMILQAAEDGARRAGFGRAILGATVGGEPLYRACGYVEEARSLDNGVPIVQMGKDLTCQP